MVFSEIIFVVLSVVGHSGALILMYHFFLVQDQPRLITMQSWIFDMLCSAILCSVCVCAVAKIHSGEGLHDRAV